MHRRRWSEIPCHWWSGVYSCISLPHSLLIIFLSLCHLRFITIILIIILFLERWTLYLWSIQRLNHYSREKSLPSGYWNLNTHLARSQARGCCCFYRKSNQMKWNTLLLIMKMNKFSMQFFPIPILISLDCQQWWRKTHYCFGVTRRKIYPWNLQIACFYDSSSSQQW